MAEIELRPSGSGRWINCSASPHAEAKALEIFGEEPPSPYAQEGTNAHIEAEKILTGYSNLLFGLIEADLSQEMHEALYPYIKAIAEDMQMKGAKLFAEKELQSSIDPRLKGTADAIVYSVEDKKLIVSDLKYGAGVFVPAESTQIQIYAMMALETLGEDAFDTVITRIVQPRYKGNAPVVREKEYKVGEWYEPFKKKIKTAIEAVDNAPATFTTGDHCRWCKGAPICGRVVSGCKKAIETDIGEDTEDLKWLLDNRLTLKSILDTIEAKAAQAIENGNAIPGYEVVEKFGNAKWNFEDEKKFARTLKRYGLDTQEVWDKKLITVSQAKKKIKDEKFFEKYTTKESKGKTVKKVKEENFDKLTSSQEEEIRSLASW